LCFVSADGLQKAALVADRFRYDKIVSLASISPNRIATMAVASIQDRTAEFKSVLAQAQRRQAPNKVGAQRRSLLTDAERAEANGDAGPTKSEFARQAAQIGRGISATMGKLQKLAQRE
jgi:Syntaxin-5 N-terminal, Sly1p-binding domain